jgi:hypothetical protein
MKIRSNLQEGAAESRASGYRFESGAERVVAEVEHGLSAADFEQAHDTISE